jgi:hypothetical protein
MRQEASVKSQASTLDRANTAHLGEIFLICDQEDSAAVWGYVLCPQGLSVILGSSLEKAIDRGSTQMPNNARKSST